MNKATPKAVRLAARIVLTEHQPMTRLMLEEKVMELLRKDIKHCTTNQMKYGLQMMIGEGLIESAHIRGEKGYKQYSLAKGIPVKIVDSTNRLPDRKLSPMEFCVFSLSGLN